MSAGCPATTRGRTRAWRARRCCRRSPHPRSPFTVGTRQRGTPWPAPAAMPMTCRRDRLAHHPGLLGGWTPGEYPTGPDAGCQDGPSVPAAPQRAQKCASCGKLAPHWAQNAGRTSPPCWSLASGIVVSGSLTVAEVPQDGQGCPSAWAPPHFGQLTISTIPPPMADKRVTRLWRSSCRSTIGTYCLRAERP